MKSSELAGDLQRIAIVAGEPVRLSEQRPMLTPRKLPRQLDVGAGGPHLVEVPLRQRHRVGKAQSRDGVQRPVDQTVTTPIVVPIGVDGRVTARCQADRTRVATHGPPPRWWRAHGPDASRRRRSTASSGRSTNNRPSACRTASHSGAVSPKSPRSSSTPSPRRKLRGQRPAARAATAKAGGRPVLESRAPHSRRGRPIGRVPAKGVSEVNIFREAPPGPATVRTSA